jgi:hypothetical protein
MRGVEVTPNITQIERCEACRVARIRADGGICTFSRDGEEDGAIRRPSLVRTVSWISVSELISHIFNARARKLLDAVRRDDPKRAIGHAKDMLAVVGCPKAVMDFASK